MEDPERDGVGTEAETITDIQNYLASFNKEIQDGSGGGGNASNASILPNVESSDIEGDTDRERQAVSSAGDGPTTYYVTPATNGSHVEEYQYATQSQAHYDGTTYYASSDGTYYTTTDHQSEQDDHAQAYETVSAYSSQGDSSLSATVLPVSQQQPTFQQVGGTRQQIVSATKHQHRLQQIVLAVSDTGVMTSSEVTESEAQEISVTIPASLTGQVGDSQNHVADGVDGSEQQQQPTFVAMQPSSSQEGPVEADVGHEQQELATLIPRSDDVHSHDEGSSSSVIQPHTIRMVVRQADGTETEQTIPVSTARGPTLVTSDGHEIHVSGEGTLQMMASLAEQAAAGGATDGTNQVILNTGNSYQTVTIVPSDTNPGEVSYVLIVSQSDDDKECQKGLDVDMSVYDFNEGEKHGEVVAEEVSPDGTKMRTIRITPRKSQIVTQAHMCNYCNYTSPKRYLLSRHMKSHSEERPHKCSVCERGFKTLASLQNHVNTHTGTRPHQCKECQAAFTTSGELVRHVRYKHTHEKPHRCTECDYASVELSKLKRHMRCHTGERPYQCPHCTYASPDTYKLKRHLRIHTGEKPYECDVCQARFTQSNSLKAHKLIHSGNKPVFHCDYCPTTCGRKTDLRIHVQKLHTSDKPLKCKRCGKSFPDRYTYKVHSKTHEGEKCFKCDLCPYASISSRHLESHMLIHTDQKPYHCDECEQSFRQKQLLKRHKNLYHDPNYVPPVPREKTHECPECGKAFRHKGNLIRHMAIHDPEASAAERAEAMRIGEPKGPGEQPDGEEDYYDEETGEDGQESLEGLQVTAQGGVQETQDGQQVVVFEVIQLQAPDGSTDGQQTMSPIVDGANTVTVTTANGETGLAILQQVPVSEESLADAVAAAVAQVHGEDSAASVNEDLNPSSTEEEMQHPSLVITQAQPQPTLPPPRRRGRPRKYPYPSEVPVAPVEEIVQSDLILPSALPLPQTPRRRGRPRKYPLPSELVAATLSAPDAESVQVANNSLIMEGRQTRRRKGKEEEIVEEVLESPAKKGRFFRNYRTKIRINEEEEIQEEVEDMPAIDPAELARHEAEMVRKRLEQKEKDMAECFGFNDDEEEDETILAMPAAPGIQPLVHSDIVMDSGKSDSELKAENLLIAIQQNGNLHTEELS